RDRSAAVAGRGREEGFGRRPARLSAGHRLRGRRGMAHEGLTRSLARLRYASPRRPHRGAAARWRLSFQRQCGARHPPPGRGAPGPGSPPPGAAPSPASLAMTSITPTGKDKMDTGADAFIASGLGEDDLQNLPYQDLDSDFEPAAAWPRPRSLSAPLQ